MSIFLMENIDATHNLWHLKKCLRNECIIRHGTQAVNFEKNFSCKKVINDSCVTFYLLEKELFV